MIETSHSVADKVVIGVGMNVSLAPDLDDPDAPPTRSVAQVAGRDVARYEILHSLVAEIIAAIDDLKSNEHEILGEFRSRCLLTGRRVTFQEANRQYAGHCCGITDEGHLEIQTPTRKHQLQSGEAQLLRTS